MGICLGVWLTYQELYLLRKLLSLLLSMALHPPPISTQQYCNCVRFELVQAFYILSQSLWTHLSNWLLVSTEQFPHCHLPPHALKVFPPPSSTMISEPWGEKNNIYVLFRIKQFHFSVWWPAECLCVNCHVVEKEASLMFPMKCINLSV